MQHCVKSRWGTFSDLGIITAQIIFILCKKIKDTEKERGKREREVVLTDTIYFQEGVITPVREWGQILD